MMIVTHHTSKQPKTPLQILLQHTVPSYLNCYDPKFGLQFHSKALLEEWVGITSATTETNHWILFIWLILLTTNQALVPQHMKLMGVSCRSHFCRLSTCKGESLFCTISANQLDCSCRSGCNWDTKSLRCISMTMT